MKAGVKTRIILLLSIPIAFAADPAIHCEVSYLAEYWPNNTGIHYSLNGTLLSTPNGSDGKYCNFSKSSNWIESDSTEISCNEKLNVWIKLNESMDRGQDAYVRLNCTASFRLGLSLQKSLAAEGLDVIFGNVGESKYWLAVNFPQYRKLFLRRGVFSGNYTFFSLSDSNVNSSINFHVGFEKFTRSLRTNIGVIGNVTLTLTSNLFECKSDSFVDYFANVAGKNPWHSKALFSCLNEDKICSGKNIGTRGDESGTTSILDDFHPHGAVSCIAGDKRINQSYFTSINGYTILQNESDFWDEKNLIELGINDHMYFIQVNSGRRVDMQLPENKTLKNEETFFETEEFSLECKFLDYILKAPVIWSVIYSNGTEVIIGQEYNQKLTSERKLYLKPDNFQKQERILFVTSSVRNISATLDMKAIKCSAPFWNSSDFYASAVQPVHIKSRSESSPPVFSTVESLRRVKLGDPLELHCTAEDAFPNASYDWTPPSSISNLTPYDASLINKTMSSDKRSSILWILSVKEDHEGEYICNASNFGGEAQRRFYVSIDAETSPYIYLGVAVSVVAILVCVLAVLARMYYLQRGRLTAAEIKLFNLGDATALLSGESIQENAQYLPYNRDFEIKWNDFHISEEILGEGAYGIVYKGYLKKDPNAPVAIKTVKPGVEKHVIMALLSELKIMIYLGNHENLVEIKGACTEFLREGRVYVIVEFCPMGSLENYLKQNKGPYIAVFEQEMRSNVTSNYTTVYPLNYCLTVPESPEQHQEFYLDPQDLVNWSLQIARAMSYLTAKKVIHGDLATRNILLVNREHLKITDFGLSCQLLKYEEYKKNYEAKLPWRWLPPETLKTCKFTSKSDVWSFGVVLWEMYSLGDLPFSNFQWSIDFARYLENNHFRLSKPLFAPEWIHKTMTRCWATDPSVRPEFHEIEVEFQENLSVNFETRM